MKAGATVFLGLGSNVGDRRAHLAAALRRLARILTIEAVSSVYETEPVGFRPQPDFWNLVVQGRTTLAPEDLLWETLRIESELGRRRGARNAPRTIDIDILLYEDRVFSTPTLVVPHPRMMERAFVLRPLAELDPELRHPVTGERIADRLEQGGPFERIERLFPGQDLLNGENSTGQ